MSIGIGQSLGNYRVVSKLGSGGMGAVYLAEHPLIGKKVALKVIHKDLSANREVVTRFFNEARAVNQIGNDHIVNISDFGQTPEGEYFFIMELLAGRCLGDVLEEEKILSVPRALHIAAQMADALGASHAVGIIHRDLKPDNVFLVPKLGEMDFVKILDFGLAKLTDNSPQHLTKQGVILGTPQYMSPEQCESKGQVNWRSDIYALGVILYQMVCGCIPFDGQTMGEILVKHVAMPPPPPRTVNPNVAPAVEQIIMRSLAKHADERFQSMGEMRIALIDPDQYLRTVGWSPTGSSTSAMMPYAPATGVHQALGGGAATSMQKALKMPTAPHEVPTQMAMQAPVLAAAPYASAPAPAYMPPVATAPAPGGGPSRALPALQVPAAVSPSTMLLDPDVASGRPAGTGTKKAGGRRWIAALVFVVLAAGLTTGGLMIVKRVQASGGAASGTGAGVGAAQSEASSAAASSAPAVAQASSAPAPVAPVSSAAASSAPAVAQASSAPAAAPESSTASSAPAVATASSAPAVAPASSAAPVVVTLPAQVKVSLTTDPKGAEILDEAGKVLGVTPAELSLDRNADRPLRFHLAGYEEKKKVVHATGDTEIMIVLDKLPDAPPPRHPPTVSSPAQKITPPRKKTGSQPTKADPNELMEPNL